MGSLDYIAPEQIRGDPSRRPGGPVRARLSALRVPHRLRCRSGATRRWRRSSPIWRSRLRPPATPGRGCLPSWTRFSREAMAKDPADRYESCEALVAARGRGRARRGAGRADAAVAVRRRVRAVLAAARRSCWLQWRRGRGSAGARGLVRIDARTGAGERPLESAADPRPWPSAPAPSGSRSALGSSLWRIEPRSGAVKRVTTSGPPRDLTYYQGRIYVSAEGPGYSTRATSWPTTRIPAPSGRARAELVQHGGGRAEGIWTTRVPRTSSN